MIEEGGNVRVVGDESDDGLVSTSTHVDDVPAGRVDEIGLRIVGALDDAESVLYRTSESHSTAEMVRRTYTVQMEWMLREVRQLARHHRARLKKSNSQVQ